MRNLLVLSFSLVFLFQTINSSATNFFNSQRMSIQSPDSTVIPFTLYKGLIFIEAHIGEKKGIFMLDTGAPSIFLNSYRFDDLEETDLVVTGINGQIKAHSKRINQLIVNDVTWSNFDAVAVDLIHLEQVCKRQLLGLLGYNAFKDFELMIDYQNQELTLFKLDNKGNRLQLTTSQPVHTGQLKMSKHLATVEAKINEFTLKLGIDTGAQTNLLHKKWNKKLYSHFLTYQKVRVDGAIKSTTQNSKGLFDKMTICEKPFQRMKTLLTDLSHFNDNYHIKLDGLLGYEFLAKSKFSINFKKKELYFWDNIKDINPKQTDGSTQEI